MPVSKNRRRKSRIAFNAGQWLNALLWCVAILLLFTLIIGVFGFWSRWPELSAFLIPPLVSTDASLDIVRETLERQGLRGDSFGSLNTLFSGVAMVGLFGTILLQVSSNQKDQRQRHKERFDTSFFELLRMTRAMRDEVKFNHSYVYSRNATSGLTAARMRARDAWDALYYECNFILRQSRSSSPLSLLAIQNAYSTQVHKRAEITIAPYFRVIYTILNRISTDPTLKKREKIEYGNLLRSQLSSRELSVLAVNGLCEDHSGNLFDLIVEFRLLKYLPKTTVRTILAEHFPKEAFLPRND